MEMAKIALSPGWSAPLNPRPGRPLENKQDLRGHNNREWLLALPDLLAYEIHPISPKKIGKQSVLVCVYPLSCFPVNHFEVGVLCDSSTGPTGETQSMESHTRESNTHRKRTKDVARGVHHNGHRQGENQKIHALVTARNITNW